MQQQQQRTSCLAHALASPMSLPELPPLLPFCGHSACCRFAPAFRLPELPPPAALLATQCRCRSCSTTCGCLLTWQRMTFSGWTRASGKLDLSCTAAAPALPPSSLCLSGLPAMRQLCMGCRQRAVCGWWGQSAAPLPMHVWRQDNDTLTCCRASSVIGSSYI